MKPNSWNINSFKSIGWPDPFPDDYSSIEGGYLKDRFKFVYQDHRYTPDHSPFMIYIPSRHVMVKLMRSCLGIQSLDEFWIYNYPIP
jgi:hypothetical protein